MKIFFDRLSSLMCIQQLLYNIYYKGKEIFFSAVWCGRKMMLASPDYTPPPLSSSPQGLKECSERERESEDALERENSTRLRFPYFFNQRQPSAREIERERPRRV